MAEYGREQRYQLIRAIANRETGSRQLKNFVDNRKSETVFSMENQKERVYTNNVIQKNAIGMMGLIGGGILGGYIYYESAKNKLKTEYPTAIEDASAKDPKNGGSANLPDFIIKGVSGTRHHIYPKSELAKHVGKVSKALYAYDKAMLKNKKYYPALLLSKKLNKISILETGLGIHLSSSGTLIANRNSYYWHNGIYFGGVNSASRSDDPGNRSEPRCPPSVAANQTRFNQAIDFGQKMGVLATELDKLGSQGAIDSSKVDNAITAYNAMPSVRWDTSQVQNADWHLTSGIWGVRGSKYKVQ